MTEWTSIAVKSGTKERFNDLKENAEMDEEPTADSMLTYLMNGWEHGSKADGETSDVDAEQLATDIADALESLGVWEQGTQENPIDSDRLNRLGETVVKVDGLKEDIQTLQTEVNQLNRTIESVVQ